MTVSLDAAAQVYRQAARDTFARQTLLNLAQAALLIFTGVAASLFPVVASSSAMVAIGWLMIFNSALRGVGLLLARHAPHHGIRLISAVIGLLLGMLLLRHAGEGQLLLSLLVVVFLTTEGIANLSFAMVIRPLSNWAWILVSGILSIVLAVLLYAVIVTASLWTIGLMLGVHLICDGLSLGYVSAKIRAAADSPPPGTS